jgi:hypothetical protein
MLGHCTTRKTVLLMFLELPGHKMSAIATKHSFTVSEYGHDFECFSLTKNVSRIMFSAYSLFLKSDVCCSVNTFSGFLFFYSLPIGLENFLLWMSWVANVFSYYVVSWPKRIPCKQDTQDCLIRVQKIISPLFTKYSIFGITFSVLM